MGRVPLEPKDQLADCHLFRMFDKNILFNVETMLFYEVTQLVYDLVSLLSSRPGKDPVGRLGRRYPRTEIEGARLYLRKEGILREGASEAPAPPPVLKKRRGMRHLELMVTHGCNMGCRYCYGSNGNKAGAGIKYLFGSNSAGMSLETARRGVDFLFRESGRQRDLSVIFFGGEPLLEFGLIEKIVPYIREKEAETGKKARVSLSTNGVLLNERAVSFLVENRVGCQVSIDGPEFIHDRNRRLANGDGSYARLLPGVKRLIGARRGRVPARATVAHGGVNLPAVVEHLFSLGFGSVHAEPDIGGCAATAVTREDIGEMKRQNEALAAYLVGSVRRNRYFNYTNLVRFIRQTRVVRERLSHYCGAGRTYFSLSQDGSFYPCHRFVGMEEYRMGDVESGLDLTLQKKILDLSVQNRPVCHECWARYLCGGGCWKHAVEVNGCLELPDSEFSCEITKHAIECAMAINSELGVSDKEILSQLYEEGAEPYLVTEKGG